MDRPDQEYGKQLLQRKRRKIKKMKQMRRRRNLCICAVVVFMGVCMLAAGVWGRVLRDDASKESSQEKAGGVQSSVSDGLAENYIPEVRETASITHEQPERTNLPKMRVLYAIHSHGADWSSFFADSSYGMAPAGSYLTAVRATLEGQPEDMTGTIEYSVNLSGSGWLDWCEDGAEAGKADGDMALEAVRVRLSGELAEYYDVFYSVLQNNTWTEWVKNGEEAGVSGAGLHMDGVRMSVVLRQEGTATYAGNIDPEKPMVALTYDDGPSRNATPRILEKLKECQARATFFIVGQQAQKNPDLVRQIAAQGCELGNHTFDHVSMDRLTPRELAEQLMRTNQVVSDACGVTPVLIRPAGGARNEAGMSAVGAISMPAIMWSVDTLDWKTKDAASTIQTVRDQVKDGDIILMHDLYDATAEASMTIIRELTDRGFQLVTVSELSSYRGGILPGKSYSSFR